MYLQSGSQTTVHAWQHHRGFRLLHVFSGPFRLPNFALNYLELAVNVRT
jgi:hypothetical protein